MFESSTGIEQNKRVQLILAIILLVALALFVLHAISRRPNKDSVDGVYKNECCSPITIRDGRLSYRSATVDMKLLNMKFGLTGYVDGQFTSQGVRASQEATAITFSDQQGRRALTLPIDRQEHTFQMTSSK